MTVLTGSPDRFRLLVAIMHKRYSEIDAHGNNPYRSFDALPTELHNKIYNESKQFHYRDSGGRRWPLTVQEFELRYKTLLPILNASPQVGRTLKPIVLGDTKLHLRAVRNPDVRFFGQPAIQRKTVILYSHIHLQRALQNGVERHHYYEIDLPPLKQSRYFKHIKITLRALMDSQSALERLVERRLLSAEKSWNVAEVDWLYPVRELKTLGFGELEELEIEVKYYPDAEHNGGAVLEMRRWTESAVHATQIAAECSYLTLNFVQEP